MSPGTERTREKAAKAKREEKEDKKGGEGGGRRKEGRKKDGKSIEHRTSSKGVRKNKRQHYARTLIFVNLIVVHEHFCFLLITRHHGDL